jgi:hypothetical protein
VAGKEEGCHLFQQIIAYLRYSDVLNCHPRSKAFCWGISLGAKCSLNHLKDK